MPRTCSAEGCNNPIFSSNFCRYHQYLRRMAGGDLYNKPSEPRSPKSDTARRRTPKRASDERYYALQAKEFFDDAVKNGTNHCFFCGEKVNSFQGLHHTEGRKNDKLNDFTKIVIVHNDCHLYYHRATLQQLMSQVWFYEWMLRLQKISLEAYNKELNKAQKGILFSEDLDN
jgi:hypothetical protein